MRTLILITALLGLTACKEGSSGSSPAAAVVAAPAIDTTQPIGEIEDVVVAPTPTPAPAPALTEVTYYTLTRDIYPVANWVSKKVTARGNCLIDNQRVYCWDDGVHTISWTNSGYTYGPYYNTYFQRKATATSSSHCTNMCTNSFFVTPKVITSFLVDNLDDGLVQNVLDYGQEIKANCEVTTTSIKCSNFEVDLTQHYF